MATPPSAQPHVPWADATFPEAPSGPFTWMPIVTPNQVQGASVLQLQAIQANQTATAMDQVAAPTPGDGGPWMVVRRKRRGGALQHPGGNRRRVDDEDRQDAGVGTNDAIVRPQTARTHGKTAAPRPVPPSSGPFAFTFATNDEAPISPTPLPTQSPPQLQRSPPTPHLSDGDYYNPGNPLSVPAASATPEISVASSAPMEIDPQRPPSAVQAVVGQGTGARGERVSTMNVPLQQFRSSGTLEHEFGVQTPPQEQDVLEPTSRVRQPIPFTPGIFADSVRPRGGERARNAEPKQGEQTTQGRMERRRDGQQLVLRTTRQDAGSAMPSPAARDDGQRAAANDATRLDARFVAQADRDFTRLNDMRMARVEGPRHSTPATLINPLTGRAVRTGLQTHISATSRAKISPPTQRHIVQPMMPKPREGFPVSHFSDPDSVAVGSDMKHVNDMRKISEVKTVVGVRIPKVRGVPPDAYARGIRECMEQAVYEITGEVNFRIGVPRAPTTHNQGDPLPVLWYIRDLSNAGAKQMLDMQLVSCPAITFFTYPLAVKADVVIILGGFISNVDGQIENMIWETFKGEEIRAIIRRLTATNQVLAEYQEDAVDFVLETVTIEVDTLGSGAIIAKVYAENPAGNDEGWRIFREAVARVPFVDGYNPRAVVRTFSCTICSANDHPEHACPFPSLPGWCGPTLTPEPVVNDALPMGNEIVYMPRGLNEGWGGNNGGGGNGNQGGGFGQRKNFARPGQNTGHGQGPNAFGGGKGSGAGPSNGPGYRPY